MRYTVALLIAAVALGCGSSRDTREAVIPAPETSVRYEAPTDTVVLRRMPPSGLTGRRTFPSSVTRYPGRASGPATIERVEVTNDSVRIQSQEGGETVRRSYPGPPEGEELTAESTGSDSTEGVKTTVEGGPQPDTVDVLDKQEEEESAPGFFERTERNLAVIGGLVVLLVVGFFASKLNVLPW